MAIGTHSVFYYGFTITSANKFLNFDEGSGELTAELSVGSYTMTEMLAVVKNAMDTIGTDTYTVSVDRDTRKFTISSTGTFSLLLSTGSQVGVSPFSLLGFTSGSDTTTAASHTGSSGAGSEYVTQFFLQDYVGEDDFKEKIDSKVNESASGNLEVVNFGTRSFTEFSLKYITDEPGDGNAILNNSNGVADARSFLQEITQKRSVELMIDKDSRSTFVKLVLESTPTSRSGTAYKLNELVKSGLRGYYEINSLKFRVF